MTAKLRYLGHACYSLELDDHLLLFDPFLSNNPDAVVSPEDIKPDFILVTHGHSDHLGDTIKIAKNSNAEVITVNEIAIWLQKRGVQVHGQHLGGGFMYPFGYVKLTLALHGSILPDGSYGGNPAGFLLTSNANQKLYFAGDTGLFGDMKLIGDEGIKIAIIPIGDNYTMGPKDGLRAVELLRPEYVIPMHFNTFELIKQDGEAWKKLVEEKTNSKVVLMSPGDVFDDYK